MSGPTKSYDEYQVGAATQRNYAFLEELWSARGPALRDQLFSQGSEASLRALLGAWNIPIPDDVRIMLVDIEGAKTKVHSPAIIPSSDKFYVLILPPVPRREENKPGNDVYKEMQAWNSAWYHAINDGYGM